MTDAATKKKALKKSSLILLAAGALSMLAPAAFADYAECLGGPRQTDTLRNPLVPGAPSTGAGQVAYGGMPPPIGSGMVPNPVIPGDLGGPAPVTSGYSDQSSGSIFGAGGSQGSKYPNGYVGGAGRYPTKSGQQQGMYDYGQGQRGGQDTYEQGSSNAGTGTYESGAGAYYGNSKQDYGQGIQGVGTYQSGGGNGGQQTYDNGYGSSGTSTYESGSSNGGIPRQDNGGGNNGQRTYEYGQGNGGASTFSGRSVGGGTQTQDNGQGNGGTRYNEGGAGNGGTKSNDFGTGSSGNRISIEGGAAQGALGTTNSGGPRSDAQQTQDTINPAQVPSNNYDFQGPLPTVRTFCRYLVILGVVVACVWVAMAAVSVVMGNQNGPARVIGAVGGLLLLLAGYTIWKIVQMNTYHGNTTAYSSQTRGAAMARQFNNPVNVPTGSSPPEDPGQTQQGQRGGPNQQDPRQKQGPDHYRPTGPYTGHDIGPDRVGSYNIYPAGTVPEPPKSPVINPNIFGSSQ